MKEINMQSKNEGWETLGRVSVDSGQLLLIDPAYLASWQQVEFEDIRIYEHKATGARLQYRVHFENYQDPIPGYDGRTMNQLNETGDWVMVPPPPAEGLNYNAVCQTTLSSARGGEIDLGVALSSGRGDGRYEVKVRRNAEGRIMQMFVDFNDEE